MSDIATVPETEGQATALERAMLTGDLAKLKPMERLEYYREVCKSLGLNPLTKPLQYLALNGRLTLYATKDCTDQLRSIRGISIEDAERDMADKDAATWAVTARDRTGRTDRDIGSVSIRGLDGEKRANAIMKALTKAKRRVTLSLAGLGWLDESEAEDVGQVVEVDEAGNVIEHAARPMPRASQMLIDRAGRARGAEVAPDTVYTVSEAPGPSDATTAGPIVATVPLSEAGSGQVEEAPFPPLAEPPPADHAGARAGFPTDPGSVSDGAPMPAPSEGATADPLPAASPSQAGPKGDKPAARCDGFKLGRCVREAGHPGNHANKERESWTDA